MKNLLAAVPLFFALTTHAHAAETKDAPFVLEIRSDGGKLCSGDRKQYLSTAGIPQVLKAAGYTIVVTAKQELRKEFTVKWFVDGRSCEIVQSPSNGASVKFNSGCGYNDIGLHSFRYTVSKYGIDKIMGVYELWGGAGSFEVVASINDSCKK